MDDRLSCGSCGTELSATAKFCSECGAPVTPRVQSAEYKQVTVLFADVVRALLARARGDDVAYRDFRDRYRDMARSLGFEGHIDWAEAMP